MAVNLSKGQRVSLDKSIVKALVGLGWDTNKYDGGYDFDLDASAYLLGENGKKQVEQDICVKKAVEFVVENAKEEKAAAKKSGAKKTTKKAKEEAAEETTEEA